MNKNILFMAASAIALVATPVLATTGGEGGNNNCNGVGNANSPCTPSPTPTPTPTPTPGSNGNGGNGGVGNGGNGVGGDSSATSNSRANVKLAVDTNVNNTNKVRTGDVTTAVRTGDVQNNTSVATGNQSASSDQAQSQSTSNSNNSDVVVQGDEAQARNPVATAYAAPLTAGFDTCMGSSTAGAQGIGFGISLGSTWTDKNCVRLKNSRELASMGLRKASIQLLCQNKDIEEAMAAAGTPCTGIKEEE
jgi:hypothetical protein